MNKMMDKMKGASNIKNGINVNQLVGTIEAIKGDPDLAKFQFRAEAKWVKGCLSLSH